MPPKAATANGSAETENVVALCHLMAACTEFKVDTTQLTSVLNISHAKNVPRKINSIINPVGFEYRAGRIVAKDDDGNSVPATPTKNGAKSDIPKTPASKGKTSVAAAASGRKKTTPKTKANKKRKIEDVDEESSDDKGANAKEDDADDQAKRGVEADSASDEKE